MKKINLKNIYFATIASLILVASFLVIVSYSRAEDDNEGEREDYRESVQVIQPQPPVQSQPQAQSPSDAIQTPTTGSTVSDNSAILAALKDSDKDGMPDVVDQYPGEDDFAYVLIDQNNNGIADDLEMLLK